MHGQCKGRKLNNYVSDYIVFDLETTGINTGIDEVIEISALKVYHGKIVEEFTSLVNPGRSIPYSATKVNNISDSMVQDSPPFSVVLHDFLDFADNIVLVGHNIHTFDMKFLYRDADRFYGRLVPNDYVDTLSLARTYLGHLSHYKLTDLADYYGIATKGAHRALNDCYINYQIFELLSKEINSAVGIRNKICPLCGEIMLIRSGKFGKFWGYSSFPDCRHTEKLKQQ